MMIEIQERVVSLNEMLRMHWSVRRRLKKTWATHFLQHKRKAKIYHKALIIGHMGKLLDRDNFIGGCKECVVDNLRDFGFIEDDDLLSVHIVYRQCKSRLKKTSIILIEAEGP